MVLHTRPVQDLEQCCQWTWSLGRHESIPAPCIKPIAQCTPVRQSTKWNPSICAIASIILELTVEATMANLPKDMFRQAGNESCRTYLLACWKPCRSQIHDRQTMFRVDHQWMLPTFHHYKSISYDVSRYKKPHAYQFSAAEKRSASGSCARTYDAPLAFAVAIARSWKQVNQCSKHTKFNIRVRLQAWSSGL
jgi:hypothetical protein